MTDPARKAVVLVVEDEPDVLRATTLLLEAHGYAVIASRHAGEALDLLERTRPSLIISDYMMPWMDGRAFVEKLRAAPATRDIPVILVSAVSAGEGPWNAFLRKPVEFSALLATVQRLLAQD